MQGGGAESRRKKVAPKIETKNQVSQKERLIIPNYACYYWFFLLFVSILPATIRVIVKRTVFKCARAVALFAFYCAYLLFS